MKLLQNNRTKSLLLCFSLAILTALAYWPVRNSQFVYIDDQLYVTENSFVQQGLTWPGIKWAFTTGYASNWHPLTWLSHMLDVELFGDKPSGPHLVNVLFHIANALLVFLAFKQMTNAVWRSAFVAILFALHPLHVESVAWISERKDVLSTFFWMLGLIAYLAYVKKQHESKPAWPHYSLCLLFFFSGLMAKPMVVTFPFVLLLLDFWPLRRWGANDEIESENQQRPYALVPFRFLLIEKIPFLLLTIAASTVTFLVQNQGGAFTPLVGLSFSSRIQNALVSYIRYIVKMFWPMDLAICYPHPGKWPFWQITIATILLLGISALAIWLRRKKYLLVGWLWFLGTLIPVIGLVQVGFQSMADRYTYVPLIGIFVMLTWGISDALRPSRFRPLLGTAAIATIVFCLILTRSQVAHWQNSVTLFEHAFLFTKNDPILLSNVGAVRMEQGKLDEAAALLSKSLALNPRNALALNNFAATLARQGKNDEAVRTYLKSLELNSQNFTAEFSLSHLFVKEGDFQSAIPNLVAALELRPDFAEGQQLLAETYYNMGNVHLLRGEPAEAIPYFEKALKNRPIYSEAENNLGQAYLKLGKYPAALSHAKLAVQLNPYSPEARYNISEIYMGFKKFAEAEKHARVAIQLQPQEPVLHNELGIALAAQKKWDEAETAFSRALDLAKAANHQKSIEEISARLLECRNNKPAP